MRTSAQAVLLFNLESSMEGREKAESRAKLFQKPSRLLHKQRVLMEEKTRGWIRAIIIMLVIAIKRFLF
jgi:hypothetical protein